MELPNYPISSWTINEQTPLQTIHFSKDKQNQGRFKGIVELLNTDALQTYAYKVRISGRNCMSVRHSPVGWIYPSSKRSLILQITHPQPAALRIEIRAVKVQNQYVELSSGTPRLFFLKIGAKEGIKIVTNVAVAGQEKDVTNDEENDKDMVDEEDVDGQIDLEYVHEYKDTFLTTSCAETMTSLQSVASESRESQDYGDFQIRDHKQPQVDNIKPIEILKDCMTLSKMAIEESVREQLEQVHYRMMPWYIPCLVGLVFGFSFTLGYNADDIFHHYFQK